MVDLAESRWDWRQGEPPVDSPDYYLRYCKTFSRMGGDLRYVTMDNRVFLPALAHALGRSPSAGDRHEGPPRASEPPTHSTGTR